MSGEVFKCNICNGEGGIITRHLWLGTEYKKCPKCKGVTVLDWIEMIKGVDESKLVRVVKRGTISSGPR